MVCRVTQCQQYLFSSVHFWFCFFALLLKCVAGSAIDAEYLNQTIHLKILILRRTRKNKQNHLQTNFGKEVLLSSKVEMSQLRRPWTPCPFILTFGPFKKFYALRPQQPWCPASTCPVLCGHYIICFTISSCASPLSLQFLDTGVCC